MRQFKKFVNQYLGEVFHIDDEYVPLSHLQRKDEMAFASGPLLAEQRFDNEESVTDYQFQIVNEYDPEKHQQQSWWASKTNAQKSYVAVNGTQALLVIVIFSMLSALGAIEEMGDSVAFGISLGIAEALCSAITNYPMAYDFTDRVADLFARVKSEWMGSHWLTQSMTVLMLIASIILGGTTTFVGIAFGFDAITGVTNIAAVDIAMLILFMLPYLWNTFSTRGVGTFLSFDLFPELFYWVKGSIGQYINSQQSQAGTILNDIDYFSKEFEQVNGDIEKFYQLLNKTYGSPTLGLRTKKFLTLAATRLIKSFTKVGMGVISVAALPLFIAKTQQGMEKIPYVLSPLASSPAWVTLFGLSNQLFYSIFFVSAWDKFVDFHHKCNKKGLSGASLNVGHGRALRRAEGFSALYGSGFLALALIAFGSGAGFGREARKLFRDGFPSVAKNLVASLSETGLYRALLSSEVYPWFMQYGAGLVNYFSVLAFTQRHFLQGTDDQAEIMRRFIEYATNGRPQECRDYNVSDMYNTRMSLWLSSGENAPLLADQLDQKETLRLSNSSSNSD